MNIKSDYNTRCGFVAIIGRPNVGKSTLLNRFIGEKISITADKPQTTRHRILGVKTAASQQAIYIDTPGIHASDKRAINRQMNATARKAITDVDVIVFIVECLRWTAEDDIVLELLSKVTCPVLLAVNKVDLQKDKEKILPFLATCAKKMTFTEIIPIAAKHGTQLDILQQQVFAMLPASPHYFPDTQITDRSDKFRLAEIVREKLTRLLGQELPYALTVGIEHLEQKEGRTFVHAIIWVEKDSQKQIVIGKGGQKLKTIGEQARLDMNKVLNCRVHLQLWVKVRAGWSNDEASLKSLGYIDIDS